MWGSVVQCAASSFQPGVIHLPVGLRFSGLSMVHRDMTPLLDFGSLHVSFGIGPYLYYSEEQAASVYSSTFRGAT